MRGRINPAPASTSSLAGNVPAGNVWQNLDPVRFAAASGLPVLPIVVEQVDGRADGLVRDWPRPDVGIEKHRIYMMQWYAFAALAFGLWAWFTFRSASRAMTGVEVPARGERPPRQADAADDRGRRHRARRALVRHLLPDAARDVHQLRRAAGRRSPRRVSPERATMAPPSARADAGALEDGRRRRAARAMRDARRCSTRRDRRERCRAASASASSAVAGHGRYAAGSRGRWPSIPTSSSCARRRCDVGALPLGQDAIYLVDPIGNQVLAWPRDARHQGALPRPDPAAARVEDRVAVRRARPWR